MSIQGNNNIDDLLQENNRLRGTIEELSILNEIASAISSSMSLEEIETLLVKKCIKHLTVEEGVIMLLDDTEKEKPFHTMLRKRNSLAASLPFRFDDQLMGWMLKNKTSLLVDDFNNDERFSTGNNTNTFLRSLLAVPMFIKSRLIGVVVLFNKIKGNFTKDDQRLLSICASQSAQIIENARLYEQERQLKKLHEEIELASGIQFNMLPKETLEVNGFTITGKMIPAKAVGGDFFDYLRISDNKIAAWLGDVSGKGMPAALLMANIQGFLRSRSLVTKDCLTCIKAVNKMLYENNEADKYATLFYSILDLKTSKLNFVIAGHNDVIHVKKNNDVNVCKRYGIPAGIYPSYLFEEKSIKMESGDMAVIYSDGITEAEDDYRLFGEKRLINILTQNNGPDIQGLIEKIYSEVRGFAKNSAGADDQTLLIIRKD